MVIHAGLSVTEVVCSRSGQAVRRADFRPQFTFCAAAEGGMVHQVGAATTSPVGQSGRWDDRPFVSLAEAVTWFAFGEALTADELRVQVAWQPPVIAASPEARLRSFFASNEADGPEPSGVGHFEDRRSGLDRLSVGWRRLRDDVERGVVKARGRYSASYLLNDARLADVVELNGGLLATFSQFDVSTGGIRRQPDGSPDVLWQGHPDSLDREINAFGDDTRAADGYLLVEVDRVGLADDVAPKPNHSARKGRPKGAGGWALQDAPLVGKMRERIVDQPGLTPHCAAAHFVEYAAGNAGNERKQKRLAERYRKTWPN